MSKNTIEKNLNQLTKLTRNFSEVLERLQDYDVVTSSEIKQINHCSHEETSIQMLYTMVARKPLSNFDLLLYVLQDTDNEMLAKVLETSLKSGDESIAREKHLEKEDSFELYASMESGSVLISRGEMGIAEILEDYTQLRENWKTLFRMLNLPNSYVNAYKYDENFVIQATLILRDWSFHLKKNATVNNLCKILDNHELNHCSGRIHRMFNGYIDSGFAFDFPGSFSTIKAKHHNNIRGKVDHVPGEKSTIAAEKKMDQVPASTIAEPKWRVDQVPAKKIVTNSGRIVKIPERLTYLYIL